MTTTGSPNAATLVEWLRRCDREIQRQAEQVLAGMLGAGGGAVLDYAGMWEDRHGKLPPRIQARLLHRTGGDRGTDYAVDLLLPIGAFHDPTKPECLFELCMLRAEVRQEIESGSEGGVTGRLEELFAQIAAGRLVFRD